MSNILRKICEDKSKELEETKKRCSFKTLEKLISSKLEKREFKDKLISAQKNKTNFIIGEVKKQSPSAGEIISDYKPEDIAILYEKSGVGALGYGASTTSPVQVRAPWPARGRGYREHRSRTVHSSL